MLDFLLIIACICGFAANFIFTRVFQLKIQNGEKTIGLYQCLFCLIAAVSFFCLNGSFSLPDVSVLVYGLLFGLCFAAAILSIAKCYVCGSMSLTGILVNMSLIIPLFYSCIRFGERMTYMQIIGLIMILITMVLSGCSGEEKHKKTSMKWMAFLLLAFLANGFTAVIQKQYKLFYPAGEDNYFMAVAYGTAAVIFAFSYLYTCRYKNKIKFPKQDIVKLTGLSVLSGLGSCAGNGVLMHLSVKVPAPVLYPCVNGGLCVAVALVSFFCFREKLTKYKLAAVIIGIAAILVLNL